MCEGTTSLTCLVFYNNSNERTPSGWPIGIAEREYPFFFLVLYVSNLPAVDPLLVLCPTAVSGKAALRESHFLAWSETFQANTQKVAVYR